MIFRLIGILVLTAISACLFLVWEVYRFSVTPMNLQSESLVYNVPRGIGLHALSRDLERQGIIDNELYFRLMLMARSGQINLRAGEYEIPEQTTPLGLLEILSAGREVNHALTVIEGWTFQQMMEAVRAHDALVHTLADDLEPAGYMRVLGLDSIHPEGRFLADTYHFPRGATDVEFLLRAYHAMEAVLARAWERRAQELPLTTPYEALILASIIEKETGVAEERPEIAGVFVRRLNKGMRLQTDPTVIYGLGDAFDGNLRKVDLQTDSPYNTYTRAGLPPTPICLPGRAAIDAALHPADGRALYFVATGDGRHQFSTTLEEHNRAVRAFQLKR